MKSGTYDKARNEAGGGIRAVERAIAVLSTFSRSNPTLTLTEVAAQTGLDPATALRSIRTLVNAELLERHSDGSYSLGFRILDLAEVCLAQLDVRKHAQPVMRRIRDEIDESVLLSVRSGAYFVYVERFDSSHVLRHIVALGKPQSLHHGAASRVLLAYLPQEEIEAYLSTAEFRRFTDTTITDPARLREALEAAHRLGYAESENESGHGTAAVAAPIFGHRDQVVAALSTSVPLQRWPSVRERARVLIIAGAKEISRSLGQGRAGADSFGG